MDTVKSTTVLALDQIRLDGGTQTRVQLDEATITEYVEALERGDAFPPIVVFHDGSEYWLADGFHRVRAHQSSGRLDVKADVRQGTRRDAVLYSVGANAANGLRRTNADKRNAVMTLLRDPEWSQWSDREIAKRCAVGPTLVNTCRQEEGALRGHLSEKPQSFRLNMQGGKLSRQPVRKTGKRRSQDPKEIEEDDGEEFDHDARDDALIAAIHGSKEPECGPPYSTIFADVSCDLESALHDAADDCVMWLWFDPHETVQAVETLQRVGFKPELLLTCVLDLGFIVPLPLERTHHCLLSTRGNPAFDWSKIESTRINCHYKYGLPPQAAYVMAKSACTGARLDLLGQSTLSGWRVERSEAA